MRGEPEYLLVRKDIKFSSDLRRNSGSFRPTATRDWLQVPSSLLMTTLYRSTLSSARASKRIFSMWASMDLMSSRTAAVTSLWSPVYSLAAISSERSDSTFRSLRSMSIPISRAMITTFLADSRPERSSRMSTSQMDLCTAWLMASEKDTVSDMVPRRYAMVPLKHPVIFFTLSPVWSRSRAVVTMGSPAPTLLSYSHCPERALIKLWISL
mmetsp:Transcript_43108/g.58872  ORF Transcript_43108/g.58872 Transcript_43108/m.58872 type:complete len:211 (-) Transcript_43108:2223-2855(-)